MGVIDDQQHLAAYLVWLWTEDHQRMATVHRDRTFAPLAFATRLKIEDHSDWIQPNYGVSVSDVFVPAANFILRNMCSLSQLSFVKDRSVGRLEGLPSWVPDYSVMQHPSSINSEFADLDASSGWYYSPGKCLVSKSPSNPLYSK